MHHDRRSTGNHTSAMPRDTRASDRERDAVAEVLREHAVAGRLEPDELEGRLEAAYGARTLAELDEVTRDLPRAGDSAYGRSRTSPRPQPVQLAALALVIGAAIVIHPLIWLALIPLCGGKHRVRARPRPI